MGVESAASAAVPARLDHEVCRAVVGVAVRAVFGFLRRRARRDGIADGRSGADSGGAPDLWAEKAPILATRPRTLHRWPWGRVTHTLAV